MILEKENKLDFITQVDKVIASFTNLQKPISLMITLPVLGYIALNNTQKSLILLLGAMIFDLLTGILAGWVEYKSGKKKIKTPYFISSAEFRQTFIKLLIYGISILLVLNFEAIFFTDMKFQITDKKLSATEIITGVFICIEVYSSIFENGKRAGVDILKYISTIINKVKGIIKQFN